MLTYALAVLAACANAVSSVLQRKANKRVPQRENMSLRQIWLLLHQPVWFGGILAITGGFLLQAGALDTGQLSVVEPVLVLELPFTLIVASWVFRQRLGPREWLPAAAMTGGLAALLYLLAPSAGGAPRVHWYGWLTGAGANLALVGCLVLWARGGFIRHAAAMDSSRPGGSFRAALLAVAAGSTFGLTAALMKAMTRTLAGGIGDLLTAWPVYAMGWYILGEVSCAGAIIAGVIMLARSPLLSQDGSAKEDQSPGGSPGGSPGQEQAQVTMTATGSTGSMIRSYVSFIAWAAM